MKRVLLLFPLALFAAAGFAAWDSWQQSIISTLEQAAVLEPAAKTARSKKAKDKARRANYALEAMEPMMASRNVDEIRETIRANATGTYLPEILLQRDSALARWPERILVGVDAIDGQVAIEGWTRTLPLTALELARRAASAGAGAVIYTDVRRDGTGRGPNLESTATLAAGAGLPVIASGGIAGVADLPRGISTSPAS